MRDDVKEYIEQSVSLINSEDYQELYDRFPHKNNDALSPNYLELTEVLMAAGINPQLHMHRIVDSMYQELQNIPNIVIAPGIHEIGQFAFAYSNIKEMNIPNNVLSIGRYAFAKCYELEKIQFGSNIIELPDGVCDEATALTSVSFTGKLIKIGQYAFYLCSELPNANLPNTLQEIGPYAFCKCSKLTKIDIPDSVTTIGEGAFHRCTGVKVVNLGKGVKSIGKQAFKGLSATGVTVNYAGSMDDWKNVQLGKDVFGSLKQSNVHTIHCTDGDVIL